MNALMIIKSLRVCERLAADVTGVRPLPSVALPNVSDHLLFPEKTFAADMANMCFFPCVGLDVAFEVLLFLIPLRAQMTGKVFFCQYIPSSAGHNFLLSYVACRSCRRCSAPQTRLSQCGRPFYAG